MTEEAKPCTSADAALRPDIVGMLVRRRIRSLALGQSQLSTRVQTDFEGVETFRCSQTDWRTAQSDPDC